MKTYILSWVLILGSLLLIRSSFVSGAETAEATYQQGIIQETGERNLEQAIELYKEAAKAASNPKLKAKARYRSALCYERLGKTEEALSLYQELLDEKSSIPADIAEEADINLRRIKASRQPIVAASSPIVKVVYAESRPTRFLLEFVPLRFSFPLDNDQSYAGMGSLISCGSLSYFVRPTLAVGLEGGTLGYDESDYYTFSSGDYNSGNFVFSSELIQRSIDYIAPVVRVERRFFGLIGPYAKAGPAAYRFHFTSNNQSAYNIDSIEWSAGFTSEAGIVFGTSRGFSFALGFAVNGFAQKTPSVVLPGGRSPFEDDAVLVNRGFRFYGGPVFTLGFRW